MTTIQDRVFVSKAGFFTVWKLKNDFGIYNDDGVKIATVHGHGDRKRDMAEMMANAIEARYQR